MRHLDAAASLLLATLYLAGPAHAQAPDTAEARALFDRGMENASQERWVEALEAFRASLAITDRVSTRLNLASVQIRLGRHVEARDGLRGLLERDDLSASDREQGRALLERAAAGVRTVEVRVDPPESALRVDGDLVDGEGTIRRVDVGPGSHQLELRADGYETQSRELGGSATDAELRLSPVAARVRVRSNVDAASITLDGEPAGAGVLELELTPGRHELVVTAPDHDPFERWLVAAPGERLEVVAQLAPSGEDLWESPWFWVIGAAVLLAGGGLALGLALGLPSGPQYDGGTVGDVLVPR